MPVFQKYKWEQIRTLIRQREIGISKNRFQTVYRSTSENHISDLEIVRSMLCDKDAYLETIACRKMPRCKAAAFCSGRLFTENYQTWFNLYTGPTSGPVIMTSNLLDSPALRIDNALSSQSPSIRVVDITIITPPLNLKPITNQKWVSSHLLLLTKDGWLYEADIENCDIISKIFIPTKEYASNFVGLSNSEDSTINETESLPRYAYQRIYCNKSAESVFVQSSKVYQSASQSSSYSFCVFLIYPLRVHCHFIVTINSPSRNPPLTPDIDDEVFIVNVSRASNILFYSLNDIIKEHSLGNRLHLKQKVKRKSTNALNRWNEYTVGNKEIGIPYTMRNVILNGYTPQLKSPCLLKTAAVRHRMYLGGFPIHYIISTNKSGTLWMVKHINNESKVVDGKIQVERMWNSSHWDSISFVCNYGDSRIVKQGMDSIAIYSLRHEEGCYDENLGSTSSKAAHCRLVNDFVIDLQPTLTKNSSLTQQPDNFSRTITTSYGRVCRKPPRWSMHYQKESSDSSDEKELILVLVDADLDLNLFVLVHYRPTGGFSTEWEYIEGGSELVVSLFDLFFGKYLRSYILEKNTSPSDRDTIWFTLDQDTFIYSRTPVNDDRIHYKILRLNRKYGSTPDWKTFC